MHHGPVDVDCVAGRSPSFQGVNKDIEIWPDAKNHAEEVRAILERIDNERAKKIKKHQSQKHDSQESENRQREWFKRYSKTLAFALFPEWSRDLI